MPLSLSGLRSIGFSVKRGSEKFATESAPSDLLAWQDFCNSLEPPAEEPFVEAYRGHLEKLNAIIRATGEQLEGNLFYHHRSPEFIDIPDATRRHKRMAFAAFAMAGDRLLEVGFNAGHSALLALTANPRLVYSGIDIGVHRYTRPCFDYLRSVFGARIDLRIGSSEDVLPLYATQRPRRWQRLHIDGGHKIEIAYRDLVLACRVVGQGGLILLDDVNAKSVRAAGNMLLMEGRCTLQRLLPGFSDTEQAVLLVN